MTFSLTTFIITTFSTKTFNITFSILTFSIMTFSIMTFIKMTFSIATLSKHNKKVTIRIMAFKVLCCVIFMLSIVYALLCAVSQISPLS